MSCGLCTPGRSSQEVEDDKGKTYRCAECEPGALGSTNGMEDGGVHDGGRSKPTFPPNRLASRLFMVNRPALIHLSALGN